MAVFQTDVRVFLKLVINTETNRVLFAEAGKDFVDILCSFLTLPLETIARLVQKDSSMGPITVGCLNSLYQSAENFGLLPTHSSSEDYCSTLKINIDDTVPTDYYICSKFDEYGYRCPYVSIGTKNNYCRCGNRMNRSVSLTQFRDGFVKGATTFVITDDLKVLPHSIDHTLLGLIKNSEVKNTSSVKEMNVHVTKEQVMDLLKCSLLSKTPLTDLFLGKKPFIERSRIFSCYLASNFCGNTHITVKLVVRKSDNSILYALGGQDFANLILSFLTFSLGGVLSMLQGNIGSLGSINGLHKSITNLDEDKYLISKEAKNRLLELCYLKYYCYYQCDALDDRIIHVQLYKSDEDSSGGGKFKKMELVTTDEGRVKRPEIYLVTDDLVIEPWLSPISSLCLLNRFKTPLDDLEEKVVTVGFIEILNILKAALSSTSALTNGLRHVLTSVDEEG